MIEGVNIFEFGMFGGAFFLLFFIFMRFVTRLIDDNRVEMRAQREAFAASLHEITKKLVAIDTKLDEHIRRSDNI